ncbi:MAG: bifunctional chorismate mutase/prephenate dehydrogenase [Steroidobacter sp.]
MNLEDLRRQLDDIDERLVRLIAERQSTVRNISAIKRSTSTPLRDYGREREVLQRARDNARKAGVSGDVAEELLRTLIRYSLTQQEQTRVVEHRAGIGQRALIIGGAGKMGAWFARFMYSQGYDIEIADPNAAHAETVITDWHASDLNHDYIIVATPLGLTNQVLHELAARKPDGVVFDLGSLKTPLSTGLEALRNAGVRVTSVHPMFGPDVQLLSGRHLIFIDMGNKEALDRARDLFAPTMAVQAVMTVQEHDRLIAYVLGLSHAVNIAFITALKNSKESAPRLTELSSTTFDAQFDMARRVVNENPQLYFEIQKLNRFGQESLDALLQAVQTIRQTVIDNDLTKFESIMLAGKDYAENRKKEQ